MAENKRIVLTGAGRGLGQALVERFVEAGHTVVGCSRQQDTVAELQRRFPAPHQFDVVDVRCRETVNAWAEKVLAGGPPDLLINNAGVINQNAVLWEVPPDEFDQVVGVNVTGVFNVLHALLPAMVARGVGVIVNLSSGWGRSTSPEVAPYCASKYAVEGLTRALSQELPPGMAAVPLNPGVIDTDMLRSCFGDSSSSYRSPTAWAETAAPFLLSLGPRHNGQPLTAP